MIDDLLDRVRSQLKRTRTTSGQISPQIESALSLILNSEDSLPGMVSDSLLTMEEYEQELLLSRFFTPDQQNRADCEPAMPLSGLAAETLSALTSTLVNDTLSCPMILGQKTGICPIPEVIIDRYVRLLGLDLPVDKEAGFRIDAMMSGSEHAMAMSLARRPVWQNREILLRRCLEAMATRTHGYVIKLEFLTHFVRTYHCQQAMDLYKALASLVEAYRIDQDHPTFNQRLETRQAEAIRSRYCDDAVKQFRVAMACELLEDFDVAIK